MIGTFTKNCLKSGRVPYDYLFKPCPDEPLEDAAENVKAAWKAEYKIHSDDFGDLLETSIFNLRGEDSDDLHAFLKVTMKGFKRQGLHLSTWLFKRVGVERKLSYGEQYLHVGNGAQAAVEAIGVDINLVLSSSLVLSLNNCRYAPSIIRSVVSFSRLLDLGFTCPILARPRQKLQLEGLESINDESYDKCKSMCVGPLDMVSRKGASYILTLLMIFSRYGKKIKALRSDRGGEYLSQEFKEYLGKNGIVQHLTSPYTPQQNGVSERRNRTLLDMVRSMFNLTTLPLSFWDYALESAVRILKYGSHKEDKEVWKVDSNGKLKEAKSPKTLLLMAVPKDHLRRFHGMDDAKEIWAAIKTRFGEKGYDRFQKLLSQLDALGAGVSDEERKSQVFEMIYIISDVFEQDIQKNHLLSLTSDNVPSIQQAKASFQQGNISQATAQEVIVLIPLPLPKQQQTATPGLADEVIHSFPSQNLIDVIGIHEDPDQIDDLRFERN
ncbi:retrotransposon protein, putative, ty1-copia subclass [Tanacetum coccineum]|uniref:Retrotransposon protein, putative, ty1-copia subclass n=1 Tax=Tanacetum coccineum TaxID=301880 RepID=A0ABQ5DTW8_9ASTR